MVNEYPASSRPDGDDIPNSLLRAIDDVKCAGPFSTSGSLFPADLIDIGLSIEGIGSIPLPLTPEDAQSLVRLSQSNYNKENCSEAHHSVLRNFWIIDKQRVSFSKAWDAVLSEAVNKTRDGLGFSLDVDLTPVLHKVVVQEEGTSIGSGPWMHYLGVATLIIILPSEHEGGEVHVTASGGSMSHVMGPNSGSEYQYVAFEACNIATTDAITSGARLALIYGLSRDSKSTKIPISRVHHPNAPEMRELKRALSVWTAVADSDSVPSLLVYTLEQYYTLDLLCLPNFKGDDYARICALSLVAKNLGFELYYTVLTRPVVSTYAISGGNKQQTDESFVEQRTLEMLIPFEEEATDRNSLELSGYEPSEDADCELPRSVEVDFTEMLQLDAYEDIKSEDIYRDYICHRDKLFYDTFFIPAIVIVPRKSSEKFNVRLWIRQLQGGDEGSFCGWFQYQLSHGKKDGDWDDKEMEVTCRTFLEISEDIFNLDGHHHFTNPRSWSNAFDLIARMGSELGSNDFFRKALSLRNDLENHQGVSVIERFKSSDALMTILRRLQIPGIESFWDRLNWWISLQQSLKDRLQICDFVIDKCGEKCGIRKKQSYVCVSRRDREPTTTDFEAWKRSRVQDALLEVAYPQAGDGLILARLAVEWPDVLFGLCTSEFLDVWFENADHLLDDLEQYQQAVARADVPQEVSDRYIADMFLPAIRDRPCFKSKHLRDAPEESITERIHKVARVGRELGGDFPRLLLPFLKQLAKTPLHIIGFMDEAFNSRQQNHWTEKEVLNKLATQIFEPAITNIQFNDWPSLEKSPDEVGTPELKKLLKHWNPDEPPERSGCGNVLTKLLDQMADIEVLNPHDFKHELLVHRYKALVKLHRRKWGDVHAYTRPS